MGRFHRHADGTVHVHDHDHPDHPHDERGSRDVGDHGGYAETGPERVAVLETILAENDRTADENRAAFADAGVDAMVLGYAETATALGHTVAEALCLADYLHSTRRAVDGVPVLGGFEEAHSHATSHLLLPSDPELLTRHRPLVHRTGRALSRPRRCGPAQRLLQPVRQQLPLERART